MSKSKNPSGGRAAKTVIISLIVTLVFGALYFYLVLPPLNPQAPEFWVFLLLLLAVYSVCTLIGAGVRAGGRISWSFPGRWHVPARCRSFWPVLFWRSAWWAH